MAAADRGQPRALVVGEALVDVRTDETGGTSEHPGGSPLNIAVGLARLGVATTLATQVGADDRGELVAAHARDSGVAVLRLAPERPTSTAAARVGAAGTATYDFALTWDPDALPDPSGFDVLHVGSIAAALPPGADAVAALVAEAGAAGVPVSLDPNVRPAITPDLADVRRRVEALADAAAVVKLSDEDAETLRPGVPPVRVAADLARRSGVRLAALTLGAGGVLLCTAEASVAAPAPPVVVADTIGAGDSAMAALLAGLLVRDLLAALPPQGQLGWLAELAAGAAALTCARPGADPPWRDELPALGRPSEGADG